MKRDDLVYDDSGREYEFMAEIPGDGFLVRPVYGEGPESAWGVEPTFIEKVYAEPPVQKLLVEVQHAKATLANLRDEIKTAKQELSRVGTEYQAAVNKLAERNEALKRIGDFLDGKITHYVFLRYGNITVWEREKATSEIERSYRNPGFKLLTLYGKTGCLSWGLNQYSDGSGIDTVCVPCVGYDDAMRVVQDEINNALHEWREDNRRTNRVSYAMQAARDFGLKFPSDVVAVLEQERIQRQREAVEKARKDLEAVERKLKELESNGIVSETEDDE